jgi:rSAM/selenodomain-associated transferase 2
MKTVRFPVFALAWLGDMGLLAAIGPLGRHPVASMCLYGAGFILMLLMLRVFPRGLGWRRAFFWVLAVGLAGRLPFMLAFPPNTDIYRYIWEGALQGHGLNPYLLAPDDLRLSALAGGELAGIHAGINHPSVASIYPPLALLLFRGLSALSPTPMVFKLAFSLLDLGVLALLSAAVRSRGLEPSRLLLYAANPLPIVFLSGEGHLDALQLFFLCLGWVLLERHRSASGAFALGLAAMSKYLAAAAAPFMLRGRGGWLRRAAVLLPLVLYLPFGDGGLAIFTPLVGFGTGMHYNGALTDVLSALCGPASLWVAAAALALCLAWVFLTEDDGLRAACLGVGCLLILLPTLHPWYLLLMAPFTCVFPSAAWIYLQAAMLFTFPVMGGEYHTGVFQEIPILKMPIYLPFFAIAILGRLRPLPVAGQGPRMDPGRIAVVVPTLNEAGNIERCLSALAGEEAIREVIVADGGSTDRTVSLAEGRGARVVSSPKGRGRQIRAGVEAARAEIILVLHADSILRPGSARRILDALASHPEVAGGCFGMAFDTLGRRGRFIGFLNNLRAFATGIAFGNQAQFFRAAAIERIGGFPDHMLMEDVEASLRLKTVGRLVYLRRGVVVSGRRWRGRGLGSNFGQVLFFLFSYLISRRLGTSRVRAEQLYRRYYSI